MAQRDDVLNYMKAYGEITQMDAIYLGCYRLASVIFNLKKEGILIDSEMREVKKKDGSTARIAVYKLREEKPWLERQ